MTYKPQKKIIKQMKKVFYVFAIAAFFIGCETSKNVKAGKTILVPPEDISFTTIKNYKRFATIQIPSKGKGLSKDVGMAYNDAGEEVPRARFYGAYIQIWSDLSNSSSLKMTDGKDDINIVLEALKKKGSFGLKRYLEKENSIEEYKDVKIGGKICKRYLISYNYTKGDYTIDRYILGYIVPHNETTAWIAIKDASCHPGQIKNYVKQLDEIFKYMIGTVEFKEGKDISKQ